MNNDQLLEQLDKRFHAIEKNMATKTDIQRLDQGQEQTNKRLSTLEDGQARLEARISDVKQGQGELAQGQAQIKTAVEALQAGQDDMRDKMATEAGMMDLGAKVNRINRNHERRIEQLEEKTHTSYKN